MEKWVWFRLVWKWLKSISLTDLRADKRNVLKAFESSPEGEINYLWELENHGIIDEINFEQLLKNFLDYFLKASWLSFKL